MRPWFTAVLHLHHLRNTLHFTPIAQDADDTETAEAKFHAHKKSIDSIMQNETITRRALEEFLSRIATEENDARGFPGCWFF